MYDQEENPLIALEEPVLRGLAGDVAGRDAIDLGCGTGRHTAWLAAAGARVTAVDFSVAMLARARARPECRGVRFVVHDLAHPPLPIAGESFDRVVSGLVLEHLSNVPAFFAELHRLCRSGGNAVVSVMHPAMWLAGVQARFTERESGKKILIGSHRHTISEYVMAALAAGWRIEHLSEHEVDEALAERMPKAAKYVGWPMLVLMKLVK